MAIVTRITPEVKPQSKGIHQGAPELPKSAQIDPSVAANAAPWLDRYIEFSRKWAPRAYDGYHEAVGTWLLATLAARRVSFQHGGEKFAHLYMLLVGRTTIYTKSTAANVGKSVLKAAGLNFLLTPDEMTPQAFIAHLANKQLPKSYDELPESLQQWHLGRAGFSGQRGWYYDEFGQKVSGMMKDGGYMADFRGILRRFDNGDDKYENETKTNGLELIDRPYLTLLGSMTPADLQPYAGKGAALWGDGFWARFAFIAPPGDAQRKRGRFPDEAFQVPQDLAHQLKQWHEWLGSPVSGVEYGDSLGPRVVIDNERLNPQCLTLGAGVDDAYYAYDEALLDIAGSGRLTDLDGSYGRLSEKTIRIAALLACFQRCAQIEMRHWARAQQITERWRADLHNLYDQLNGGVEHTKRKTREEAITAFMEKRGEPVTARELTQGVRNLSAADVKELMPALVEAGIVAETKTDRTVMYVLAG